MAKVVSFRISQSHLAAAVEELREAERLQEAHIAAFRQAFRTRDTIRKLMDAGLDVEPGPLTCVVSGQVAAVRRVEDAAK